MKKTTILFAATALCGALAFNAQANGDLPSPPPGYGPNANPPGAVAYANPWYWIDGAKVKQSLVVSGCKTLNLPTKGTTLTTGNMTLFDDHSFVLYQDWSTAGGSVAALTGQWTQLAPSPASSKTFYLSINTASMTELLGDIEGVGLTNCKKTKPAMTHLHIQDSSVLVAKNTIVVKIKNNIATGSLLVKGKELSDPKGTTDVAGNLQMKLTMTGFFNADPSAP